MYGCRSYDSFGSRPSEAMSTKRCTGSPLPLQSSASYNAANNRMTSMTNGRRSHRFTMWRAM
jgi:hypothetical protein